MGFRLKKLFLFLVIYFVTLLFQSSAYSLIKSGNVSWVKFCRGPFAKLIHTGKCSKGVEFGNGVDLDCICVLGAWAIFSDGCDNGDPFTIAYGDGSCFKVDSKVRQFINIRSIESDIVHFIGKIPSDTFSNRIVETRESAKIIELVENASGQQFTQKPRASDYFRKLFCEKQLGSVPQVGYPSLLIYDFPNATVVMNNWNYLICDRRFAAVKTTKLHPGNIYISNGLISATTSECKFACQPLSDNIMPTQSHTIEKRDILSRFDSDNNNTPQGKYTSEEVEAQKMAQQNEATALILRQNNAFLLYGIKEDLNVSVNWPLMQKTNLILKTACPGINSLLQNSMIRMFRFLFAYFKNGRHPTKQHLETDERRKNILDTLDRCAKDATKIEFTYKPEEECQVEKQIISANIVGKDITNFEGDYLKLPPDEAYNKENHDVLVEAVWKTISFVHYFCAEYFMDAAFDYAALTQIWTGFLGEDIVFRWHNAEVANEAIYQTFNMKKLLDEYMRGLDVCVAISKRIATLPKWIRRPDQAQLATGRRRKLRRMKRDTNTKSFLSKCLKTSDVMPDKGVQVCSA